MKKYMLLTLLSFVLYNAQSLAQTDTTTTFTKAQPYEVIHSAKETTLRGLISRSVLEADTTFKWLTDNYKLGRPDANAVKLLADKKADLGFIVFGGTWCEDTQNLLPQFYRLTDAAGIPDSSISLIGVDRNKTTLDNLNKTFNIINVPTFIVTYKGKEIGRMVEYGKSGSVDKDLYQIIANQGD